MAKLLQRGQGGEFFCHECNRTYTVYLLKSSDSPIRVERCPFCVDTSAPELIAACKKALVTLGQAATELQSGYFARAEADLRTAIAKAEGESK